MAKFLKNIFSFLDKSSAKGLETFSGLQNNDNTDFKNYINDLYVRAFKAYSENRAEWRENRRAYMAHAVDQQALNDAVFTESGMPQIYNSAIVSDKIEDLVSIQIGSRPVVYPLPAVNNDFDFTGLVKPDEDPNSFVRRIINFCFKDLQERRKIQNFNVKACLESRLCGYVIAKIIQAYDFGIGAQDISIKVCVTEDIAIDPDVTDFSEARYIFHKEYKSPFELSQLYPDFKEEIFDSINDTSDNKRGEHRDTFDKNTGLVCVVEGYIRDYTQDEIVNEYTDETGEVIEERTLVYKYPHGRRVTFLDGKSGITILKDEANPYRTFPFAVYVPKPCGWQIIGRPEATALRALQYADDFIIQQLMTNMKACGYTWLVADRTGLIDKDALEAEGYVRVIDVDHMGGLQILGAKNITPDSINTHNVIQQSAMQISGVEAPSEGRAAGSVQSGIGISLLQEATNRKVRICGNLFVEFLADVFQQAADIMIDIYRAGRILKASEDDGIPVRLPVDLSQIVDSIEVRADADTQLPNDPVSMSNLAITLAQIRDANNVPLVDRQFLADNIRLQGLREAAQRVEAQSQQIAQQQAAQAQQGTPPNPMSPDQAISDNVQTMPENPVYGGMGVHPAMPTEDQIIAMLQGAQA